jgi:predicted nucleic acid-binding protein
MTFSSCLSNRREGLVLDSSVIINLLATGNPGAILKSLAVPLWVTEQVISEISQGVTNGRQGFGTIEKLVDDGVLDIAVLSASSLEFFFAMVTGQTANSLGDGEAATIAHSIGNGLLAAIDEKKATRIANERFGSLQLVTTVDILACELVLKALGKEALSQAVCQALQVARMQVREHQFDWVLQLIGKEQAARCSCLKRHIKRGLPTLKPVSISTNMPIAAAQPNAKTIAAVKAAKTGEATDIEFKDF